MPEDREFPIPGLAAYVGKTQKIECIWLFFPSAFSVLSGKPAEFNKPCFALVQFQMELAKALQ